MRKNVIHNFNLSIQNSADIKSSKDLTNDIIKELVKVSKEMSQQKDITQIWQEQKNQNAILNPSNFSTEGGANDAIAESVKKTAESVSNTSSVFGKTAVDTTSTTTSTFSALIGEGVDDTTWRTKMSSFESVNITSPNLGVDDSSLNLSSGLTIQSHRNVYKQQSLTIPKMFQKNSNESTKATTKNKLDNAIVENDNEGINYWTSISKDFEGEKDHENLQKMSFELLKKHLNATTTYNLNWRELGDVMVLKLLELSKERKDVYVKGYYDKLIREIKNPNVNIQKLFLEHDELFLLLKSIFPNLPDKITINTPKVIYPDLSSQKIYPNIGVENMFFIWSGVLLKDIKNKDNEQELENKGITFSNNIDVNEEVIVPPVTKISPKTIQIGGKKWLDRFKFDYVLNDNEGGGEWMYYKAKKEMNASSFGAVLVMAFAIEEGGWGKGNDQSNTHNAFSLLSKKAKSKVGTAHGNVITYATWDDGFNAFKKLIDKSYPAFNDLVTRDIVSADDINKALFSGSFHKIGGYTDSDKGKSILGVLKYAIIFRVHDINEQIKLLSKKNESLKPKEVFKPYEGNILNPISKDITAQDLELEDNNNRIKKLETERKELETSYDKL